MKPKNVTVRGRGSGERQESRYLDFEREQFDDGWFAETVEIAAATTVRTEKARSIISRNSSPDIPFEQSVNPYRGCEHGCSYCYARPTHAYLDLSPGLDFETRLTAKENAVEVLERELAAEGYRCKPIALGTNTDPYQPVERQYKITRGIIELLRDCRHPLTIVTKSHLVLRDLDVLAELAEDKLVQVFLSVTSLEPSLASSLEPRASAPFRRVETIRKLHSAGVPVGLMFAPVIPLVNDAEMETIIETCAEAGAETAGYVMLRLPLEVKELFRDWLSRHLPLRKDHVMSMIRDLRGGRDYDSAYHDRMRGTGAYAELIDKRFRHACKLADINKKRRKLDCGKFSPPQLPGTQQGLFD